MADSTTDERAQALGEQLITAHDEFRGELARLREQLDSFLAGGGSADTPAPPALDHQLRTNCLSFCEHLHGHHTAEDTRLFPYLEEHYPDLAPAIARLRDEHGTVGRLLGDIRTLLEEAAQHDPARVRDEFRRLSTELEEHLTYEEEQLVPTLNTFRGNPF
ncbi:hemerythrin HHE cation binding domain-containing protein [Haloactinospora alba]|uniref:Hemerythrin HHE cation binding domain-containing protein n=1 Tax=Haloactinospora alba TaxID=405555 RepID=A0A543NA82_9ACTN|nr:hemerythrin domain-containing protein [Haloactinospora alba]TQN28751.1 hemerythrin HHE cation binding domain-containing protein [Haloactinospora alba]